MAESACVVYAHRMTKPCSGLTTEDTESTEAVIEPQRHEGHEGSAKAQLVGASRWVARSSGLTTEDTEAVIEPQRHEGFIKRDLVGATHWVARWSGFTTEDTEDVIEPQWHKGHE